MAKAPDFKAERRAIIERTRARIADCFAGAPKVKARLRVPGRPDEAMGG